MVPNVESKRTFFDIALSLVKVFHHLEAETYSVDAGVLM